jgi:hypothetical protein
VLIGALFTPLTCAIGWVIEIVVGAAGLVVIAA